ncbi:MAG TPA: LCP family protein [Firmicutes bacterium]|jgi:LCP family protein required for cell wall assembly|nr:LCP family protein [Bacillota bacterium]
MDRNKSCSKGKKILLFILFILLLLLVAGSAWGWSVWARIYEEFPEEEEYYYEHRETVQKEPDKNITNILILGVDQRKNEAARADAIIIMSINHDTSETAMISIPRDSRVEIPGRGLDKINAAMAYGGINLMRATVEKLLGVPINHYVYTNFAGFQHIVETLGGVTIDVEKTIEVITYGDGLPPVVLQPGVQKLNGLEALAYVRYRGDPEADFGRMRRQQKFLKAVATETLQAENLFRLPKLLEQAAEYVRTDLSLVKALSLAKMAAGLDMEEIAAVTLQGENGLIGGTAYVILDDEFLEQTIDSYLRWN